MADSDPVRDRALRLGSVLTTDYLMYGVLNEREAVALRALFDRLHLKGPDGGVAARVRVPGVDPSGAAAAKELVRR